MRIKHQKNILFIDPRQKTYSGSSVYEIALQTSSTIRMKSIELEIVKVQVLEMKTWKEAPHTGGHISLPEGTTEATVRIVFVGKENNQSIDFYQSKDLAHIEFVGSPVEGQSESLFPALQSENEQYDIEMVYIVPNISTFLVVSSGTLAGIHDGGSTKTFHYQMEQGRAQDIVFSGGLYEEFQSGKVSIYMPARFSDKYASGRKETFEVLKSSQTALHAALEHKLPIARMLVVFSMCEIEEAVGRNCAVMNISQIIIPEAIDQCFSAIHTLAKIITHQYFGVLAYATAATDVWIYTGLSEHLSMYLVELFLGVNEVRYELNRRIEYIHREDIEEPPLASPERSRHSFRSEFFVKKSGAFMRVLENNLTRAFMQKIMKEVLDLRTATTQDLMRIVKGITGKDLRTLFDFYIYRAGIPTVIAQIEQNTRIGGFSVSLRQKCYSVHPDANRHITGNICVRVYETDSVLDHMLFIGSTPIAHELSCHQRSLRKKQRGSEEGSSLLWIRIDPGLEWMKIAVVEQADYMFAEQLVSEKDAYGQMEALSGMQKNPSESICAVLERVMADPQVFYKVSLTAGILLAKSINEESGYFGFQRVVQYFINNYCIQNTTIVKTNDFSQFRSYFMQKNIASSMSLCQLDATKTLGGRAVRAKNVVSAFLLNLIRYNDNTGNGFDDSFYLADIITALALALCSDAYLDTTPFVLEIERLRKKDLIFPSHQNVVTVASIKALTRLAMQGHLEVSPAGLVGYIAPENFYKVRMAACESLILLHLDKGILPLILDTMVTEVRIVRVYVLKTLQGALRCASLPLFKHIAEERARIEKLPAIFTGDSETETLVDAILQLLSDNTEIVTDAFGEETAIHDLSSDEPEQAQPKIAIKLSKPLVVRIPLAGIPSVHSTASAHQSAPEYSPELTRTPTKQAPGPKTSTQAPQPAIPQKTPPTPPTATPVPVPLSEAEINQLYLQDEHLEKYLLDKTPSEGMNTLLAVLKTNKAHGLIVQNGKKALSTLGITLQTLNTIPNDLAPEVAIVSLATAAKASEKKPFIHTLCYQVSKVFVEFFTTSQYDTSAYNTVKYFQAYFEREYASTHQLAEEPFHKIDTHLEGSAPGRCFLIERVEQIMLLDQHGIFTVPIDVEKLKAYKYQEIIRRPLDLLGIKEALLANTYVMVECLLADVLQVFDNCTTYNQKDSSIFKEAENLKKQALPILQEALTHFTETVSLTDVLAEISQELIVPEYQIFHERVDHAAYPQYYTVVARPMTLQQVRERAQGGQYKNIAHFEADIQKIHVSSTQYNGSISEITKLSKKLTTHVQSRLKQAFPWHKSPYVKRAASKQSNRQ
ncbi:transcription initiation factor TFIID subunit 2 [Nematocida displodere]|uniref:Transcription initiation factor TFIID subunit 2 n=1 Tax=Nematocida displodere TaxID=1805483 RepID=A0A177EIF1_9MICR|nr:transcription initiation factor TFIID subunit 2 [Nematocida displodere]